MNFYKHHLGDYADATAHLTWDEDMAYTRLLRVYYRTESPIPKGKQYRLCRASTKKHKKAVDTIISEFFHEADNFFRNSRADREISAYQAQRAVNQVVGKLGGRPRRNRINTESDTIRNPNQIPEPDTREVTPLASSPNGLSAGHNGESVCYIPLVDGSEFGLSESDLNELKKAYPALNCKQTMLEIRAWCNANPTKKKTRRGAMRFINAWMARLQDRAH